MRLWEVEHPYYCAQGCFFHPGCHRDIVSWEEFVDGWGDNDPDYNLLFRWDWYEGEEGDMPAGGARLRLYYFLQRKGYPISVEVKVTRDDEPSVREWLNGKWQHMRSLWAPLAETP